MKNLNIFLNELTLIPTIGPKQAQSLSINLIKNKNDSINKFQKLINLLSDIKFCNTCNLLYESENCENCNSQKEVVLVFENLIDFFKLNSVLISSDLSKFFNLDFERKNDYLQNQKVILVLNRLESFLKNDQKITKISFLIPLSLESEILIKVFKKDIKDKFPSRKFVFTKLKIGIPTDLSLSYVNSDTIKHVINNQEEI